jgi:type IV secretion system protein TrbG
MKPWMIAAGLISVVPSLGLAEENKAWAPHVEAAKETPARPQEPPRLDPLAGHDVPLAPKERRGVAFGQQWANNRDQPARGADGSTVFLFGATLPTVVCAPLYVCDLVLEESESVNDLHVGDSVRWQIAPATQGPAEKAITHIIIKPTDIGLTTNLVLTTNRRAYTIKLISQREAWMPRVSFHYPEATTTQWNLYRSQQDRLREEREALAESAVDTGRPDVTYALSGDDPAWRPRRVFARGGKTYIQFPRGIAEGDLPALVAIGNDGGLFTEPSKELVNYRFIEGRFVVDKVLDRAALISGVGGSQVKVDIERQGRD